MLHILHAVAQTQQDKETGGEALFLIKGMKEISRKRYCFTASYLNGVYDVNNFM